MRLPGSVERVARHRDIVKQGEITTEAVLVVSGTVGRFKQARDGTRQLNALYITGDMPDLHSVVLPRSPSALTALDHATVYRVAHRDIRKLTRQSATIAEAFWRDTMVDADIATEWVFVLGRLPAIARIAHLLCELSARYEQIGADPSNFSLQLNQQHMADATGLTSVHVNRMVRQLREAGLISINGADVTILDRGGLASVGEFDGAYLHLPEAMKRERSSGREALAPALGC